MLDPLDVADHEEALSRMARAPRRRARLAHRPAARCGRGRPRLVRAGRARARGTRRSEPGLEWVASTLSVANLLAEVKESTRRISELVAAVRSYSQMDRASLQHIDVTDGLESTLVMLGSQAPRRGHGRAATTTADVPQIDAYAGELNQVWTNLIDNAVDAMDGAGTLTGVDPRRGRRGRRRDRRHGSGHAAGGAVPGPSRRSTRPRTWARAPVSASTSRAGSSSSGTAARSRSTPTRADGAAGPHPRPASRAIGAVERLSHPDARMA